MHPDAVDDQPGVPSHRWPAGWHVLVRFGMVYFALYVVFTQMLSSIVVPLGEVRWHHGGMWPLRVLVTWVGPNLFGVTPRVNFMMGLGGDTLYDWLQVFCLLVISAVTTGIWSVLDRRRAQPIALLASFHVLTRFALGATLAQYGMLKVLPMQMPPPGLARLVEPFGHFSPMGVLWASIGASPAYQTFTGLCELSAAILLFIPRTAVLGGLLATAATLHVFVLNMTYDVPVKLMSFHLLLMSCAVVAPHSRRLFTVLVLDRPVGASIQPKIGRTQRAIALATAGQLVVGGAIVSKQAWTAAGDWRRVRSTDYRSPLYGVWDVESMTIDGMPRPPLITDDDRWRRILFDQATEVVLQRMDDTVVRYAADFDHLAGVVTLTPVGPGQPGSEQGGRFRFIRPVPERLTMEGELNGHNIHVALKLFDH